jgi:hypothetical protein
VDSNCSDVRKRALLGTIRRILSYYEIRLVVPYYFLLKYNSVCKNINFQKMSEVYYFTLEPKLLNEKRRCPVVTELPLVPR